MDTDPCKILPQNVGHKVSTDLPTVEVAPMVPARALELRHEALGDSGDHGGGGSDEPGTGADDLGSGVFALATVDDARHLTTWARRYLVAEVIGVQSPNTVDAKSRDLGAFIRWFMEANGHVRATQWMPRDTQEFLNHLEGQGRAATTINRVLATLRRFARWMHAQPGNVFAVTGLPTHGIRELATDEPECKKVERRDLHALFKAADALVLLGTRRDGEPRKNARPRRNRAILALLRYTGLRVSELVALKRSQLQDNYLVNVARKGKARSRGVYIVAECRRYLDDYIVHERPRDDLARSAVPLFLPTVGAGFLSRKMVNEALNEIAAEANKNRPEGQKIHLTPHRLRHSFGADFRAKTGSDTETAAALGHTGLKYVGRYVRKSQDEREATLEAVFK